MNLFSIIPENLFLVFSGTLRHVYADLLLLIYRQHQLHTHLDRETVVGVVQDYLESRPELDLSDLDEDGPDARQRANACLRRLEDTGWLELEVADDYSESVNLADYAVELLESLDRLSRRERREYQGFVFATYTLLASDEVRERGCDALQKAVEQTQELVRGLKSLSQNIRRYLQQLLDKHCPKDILALHLEDYHRHIVDRNYHRLKTSDSVYKYRPLILQRIDHLEADRHWVRPA